MTVPIERNKDRQLAVKKDALAIARLLNLTRKGTIHKEEFLRGQYAIFSAMHDSFASDGNSRWKITAKGNQLIALLNWDGYPFVIVAEVYYHPKKKEWVGKGAWRRHK